MKALGGILAWSYALPGSPPGCGDQRVSILREKLAAAGNLMREIPPRAVEH